MRVDEVLRIEQEAGLHHVAGYLHLRRRTEAIRHALLRFLLDCRAEGKRVVGYGAPGKGNTLLNYCGIRSDLLEYTVDRNPYKHGRFTPGTRIPIYEPAQIDRDRPDVVLALPWNLEAELTEQLALYRGMGRRTRLPASDAARSHTDSRRQQEITIMKVVLFCGGYGMRMRNSVDDDMPKPMQMVGPRPLIWHVMRYYAHYGHKEFILCLGYGASHIKNFFLTYQEAASNDFIMSDGESRTDAVRHQRLVDHVRRHRPDSAIGERLRRVRPHLDGDEYFLANYADVLTDAPMDDVVDKFHKSGAAASMMIVPPQSSFHCVEVERGR